MTRQEYDLKIEELNKMEEENKRNLYDEYFKQSIAFLIKTNNDEMYAQYIMSYEQFTDISNLVVKEVVGDLYKVEKRGIFQYI